MQLKRSMSWRWKNLKILMGVAGSSVWQDVDIRFGSNNLIMYGGAVRVLAHSKFVSTPYWVSKLNEKNYKRWSNILWKKFPSLRSHLNEKYKLLFSCPNFSLFLFLQFSLTFSTWAPPRISSDPYWLLIRKRFGTVILIMTHT